MHRIGPEIRELEFRYVIRASRWARNYGVETMTNYERGLLACDTSMSQFGPSNLGNGLDSAKHYLPRTEAAT
jgi:hypothetical protein